MDALGKAPVYPGDDTMMFGSDSSATGTEGMRQQLQENLFMLREQFGVRKEKIEKIFFSQRDEIVSKLNSVLDV